MDVCKLDMSAIFSFDFATIEEGQLARLLEDFYCSLRKKDGTEYKRSSYLAQHELNRLERNEQTSQTLETFPILTGSS